MYNGKPQLADDLDMNNVRLPAWVQPKIDGVRAWNPKGTLLGRSMKTFEGFGVTDFWSKPELVGLDGEMILGDDPRAPRLCSITTGALGRFKGVTEMSRFSWWVFDLVTPETYLMPYEQRYEMLEAKVRQLSQDRDDIYLVERSEIHDMDQLNWHISKHLDEGYEGTITRNHKAPVKEGRPGKKTQELMRMKPWLDAELLVTKISEGNSNNNEAKINELGHTERSTAKAGLTANGRLANVTGTLLKDVHDTGGKLLFPAGMEVTISKGEMTVEEQMDFWQNPEKIVGKIAKFVHFAYGVKNTVRMAQFKSLRLKEDM